MCEFEISCRFTNSQTKILEYFQHYTTCSSKILKVPHAATFYFTAINNSPELPGNGLIHTIILKINATNLHKTTYTLHHVLHIKKKTKQLFIGLTNQRDSTLHPRMSYTYFYSVASRSHYLQTH